MAAHQSQADRVTQGDVALALETITRDADLPDEWRDLFDGTAFNGTQDQLQAIRSAMRDYEQNEATLGEDKSYYTARYHLQFLETSDP